MNRSFPIRVQAELSFAIALAAVLSLLKLRLPHLLYGGSVSLESVPLFVAAFRHGPGPGAMAGLAYGVVHFAMSPYFVHPIQLALDYPLAYATVGIAALGRLGKSGKPPWLASPGRGHHRSRGGPARPSLPVRSRLLRPLRTRRDGGVAIFPGVQRQLPRPRGHTRYPARAHAAASPPPAVGDLIRSPANNHSPGGIL